MHVCKNRAENVETKSDNMTYTSFEEKNAKTLGLTRYSGVALNIVLFISFVILFRLKQITIRPNR